LNFDPGCAAAWRVLLTSTNVNGGQIRGDRGPESLKASEKFLRKILSAKKQKGSATELA
jgi:hypothetical protein